LFTPCNQDEFISAQKAAADRQNRGVMVGRMMAKAKALTL
jgi:hypothetical protein